MLSVKQNFPFFGGFELKINLKNTVEIACHYLPNYAIINIMCWCTVCPWQYKHENFSNCLARSSCPFYWFWIFFLVWYNPSKENFIGPKWQSNDFSSTSMANKSLKTEVGICYVCPIYYLKLGLKTKFSWTTWVSKYELKCPMKDFQMALLSILIMF